MEKDLQSSMKEIAIDHLSPSFIFAAKIDLDLCDEIIADFKEKDSLSRFDKIRGYFRLNDRQMDPELMKRYLGELQKVFDLYKKKYTWVHTMTTPWSVMSPYNIQKYEPGFAYNPIHIEEGGPREGKIMRNLAFVTYLNDIQKGGETEFIYQDVKIKPQKGLTTIFPAGWTHPHRGIAALKETKYIVTGWSSYHHRC